MSKLWVETEVQPDLRGATGIEPATTADLVAALIAEGGETIWWCEQHDSAGTKTRCEFAVLPMMNPAVADYCRMVEKMLVPIPVDESAEAKETP